MTEHTDPNDRTAADFVGTLTYPDHLAIAEVFDERFYALPQEYRRRALVYVDRIRSGDDKARARKVAFEMTDTAVLAYFAPDPVAGEPGKEPSTPKRSRTASPAAS